ncbi:MAG: zf-HC2 domain-containing protein [Planctomycetaceae bacterium]
MTTPGPDERLSAYFDGELSAAERAEVERLLTERSDLRHELNGMADLSLRLNDLAEDVPDFDLRPHVIAQITSKHRSTLPTSSRTSPSARQSWMPMFLSVCSLVLLAAVIWPLLPMSGNLPQLAQHDAAEKALAVPKLAVVKAPAVSQESDFASSELGILTNDSLVDTSGTHGTLNYTANQAVSPDGKGPSVLLAQIEKSRGLKAGEIVSRMIESGDTPMLAEYTVVDVRRTAQDVEVLLKEHGIQPLVAPASDSRDASPSSTVTAAEAAPLRVYLLDAETTSLNTAIFECKGLQEVVATKVESCAPSSQVEEFLTGVNAPEVGSYFVRDGKASTSPGGIENGALNGSEAASPANPTDPTAEFSTVKGKVSVNAISNANDSPGPAEETSESVVAQSHPSFSTSSASPMTANIAGNSLVVENGVEVYAALQNVMNQTRQASQANQNSPVPQSDVDRYGIAESRSKDHINQLTRPESRGRSMSRGDLSSPQPQKQMNLGRQRAFLILRPQSQPASAPQSTAPPQPPEPPEPVPVQTPD